MSAHPTAAVSNLLQPIREAEEALAKAQNFLATLEMRHGQETAKIVIGGRGVALTELDRGYMPAPVKGRQALRDAVIREQLDYVQRCRSRVEGLHHQLVQAAKACGAPNA